MYQLDACWRIDGEVWQGIVSKKLIMIWTVFGHTSTSPLPESINPTYKFCTGALQMSLELASWQLDCVVDASIAMCENTEA